MLFRRKSLPRRRQRSEDEQLQTKAPSTYAYSSQRSSNSSNPTRQTFATPSSPDSNKKLSQFWLERVGLLILLVIATASAVNVLSLAPTAKIVAIGEGAGFNQTFLKPDSAYQSAVNQILSSSIKNRSKLTIDTGQISQELLKEYPEIASATVTIPLVAHHPIVYIQSAQAALILSSSNGSFLIENNGKALVKLNNTAQASQSVPILTDQSGLNVQISHQVLPTSYISFVKEVVGQLAAKQLSVSNMILPSASNELDVHLVGQAYYVKFNLQSNNPKGEAGTFLAAIAALKKQNITPSHYVDVRVDQRAYYQ